MLNISSNIIRTEKRKVRVMRINFHLTTLFFSLKKSFLVNIDLTQSPDGLSYAKIYNNICVLLSTNVRG